MAFNEISTILFSLNSDLVSIFTEAILWIFALMTLAGAVFCGVMGVVSRRLPRPSPARVKPPPPYLPR